LNQPIPSPRVIEVGLIPSGLGARWRGVLKIAVIILVIVTANFTHAWIVDALQLELRPSNEDLVHKMTMVAAVIYAVLIAIPFVPGVEIGLTLIGMLGPAIAFLVYVSTLIGLSLSFVIGRLVSLRWLVGLFDDFQLYRASKLLENLEPLDSEKRLNYLISKAPNRLIPYLLRHRYFALAVIINLPGNIVIGGGGGISLMAGASHLFSVPAFVATIAIAVFPVPIAIAVFGNKFLTN